ncbi:MAG: hypothetical protein LBB21_02490 [Holosporaceae bacterium]|jgi:hypothetical protein|nr:hypothetical protein [Holosporaceae bacterium]
MKLSKTIALSLSILHTACSGMESSYSDLGCSKECPTPITLECSDDDTHREASQPSQNDVVTIKDCGSAICYSVTRMYRDEPVINLSQELLMATQVQEQEASCATDLTGLQSLMWTHATNLQPLSQFDSSKFMQSLVDLQPSIDLQPLIDFQPLSQFDSSKLMQPLVDLQPLLQYNPQPLDDLLKSLRFDHMACGAASGEVLEPECCCFNFTRKLKKLCNSIFDSVFGKRDRDVE